MNCMTNLTINPEQSKSMANLSHVAQEEGSPIMEFNLTNGVILYVNEELVLDFIEKNGLNVSYDFGGNTGIGEPWNDLPDAPVVVDPIDYLEDNFNATCLSYFIDVMVAGMKSKTLEALESKLKELDAEDRIAIKDGDLDKSYTLSLIKCTLMDLRVVLAKELYLFREAV